VAENVDVKAKLTLDTKGAKRQAERFKATVRDLQSRLRGTQSIASGVTGRLLAIGATYVGITQLSRAFIGATRSAMTYTSALESTRIGLTSVLQAVDGGDWESSARTAAGVFETLKNESIKSVATAQQMFAIFTGIVGPIRNAGFELSTVVDLTRDAVNASTALGVDLAQAQRDIGLMVRGTAGMDVKLFSILRSTGAIAEDTEQWNKNLTAQERVEKLQEALAKFAPAGKRFAKSWAGVTSTFKGIRQEMGRAAFQPIMDTMAKNLSKLNTHLITNQAAIQTFMKRWGTTVAINMQAAIGRTVAAFKVIVANWDNITRRIDSVISRVQAMAPTLAKAGIVGVAATAGRPVLAGTVGLAGGAVGLFSGGAGAATAAAGGTAATAAAGGTAAGAGAGAAGVLAPLAIGLAAVAVAAGVLVKGWEVVKENLYSLRQIFVTQFEGITGDLIDLFKSMWRALGPVLKMTASVFIALWAVLLVQLVPVLRILILSLSGLFALLGDITTAIDTVVSPAFNSLFGLLSELSRFLMGVARTIAFMTGKPMAGGATPGTAGEAFEGVGEGVFANVRPLSEALGDALVDSIRGIDMTITLDKFKVPAARGGGNTIVDGRGARITIKQEFAGKADPDRIVFAMMKDLSRQAEQRLSTGFAGALTR